MSQTGKCSQCLNIFTISKMPRKLPCCQHNICEPCLKQIIDAKQQIIVCAFCSSEVKNKEIIIFPLNTSILLTQSQAQTIKIKSSTSLEEEQSQGDLLGSDAANIEQNQEWCQIHKIGLDVICISDKQKICPHCALFGNHKNHRFKRVEDFEKEIQQKCDIFKKIEAIKQNIPKAEDEDFHSIFQKIFKNKKIEIENQINKTAEKFIQAIRKKKQVVIEQMEAQLQDLQKSLKNISCFHKYEKIKCKMQNWQKDCQNNIEKIQKSKRVEDKIEYFYDSPLQIVTQGYVYIEEMCKYRQQALKKFTDKISEVRLLIDSEMLKIIDGCFKLGKPLLTSYNSRISQTKIINQQESEANPFLDCTASEIANASQSFIQNNNNSIEVDIFNIVNSCTKISGMSKTNKKGLPRKSQTKQIKINDLKNKMNNILPKKIKGVSPKNDKIKRKISEFASIKSPPKIQKFSTANQISCQPEIKAYELKEPDKIYAEFSKNTLTDFFDISQCNLPNEKAIEYVHRARRIHKIKGLKLCTNQVTTAGFQKMIQFLQGICNINLANNQVSEGIFDVILKNRDRLESLRVLNLTHNPIHMDKKAANKMEEVKKMGIIVVM